MHDCNFVFAADAVDLVMALVVMMADGELLLRVVVRCMMQCGLCFCLCLCLSMVGREYDLLLLLFCSYLLCTSVPVHHTYIQ